MKEVKSKTNDHEFKNKVIEVVSKIPIGKTLTYKEVATLTGSPKAYRAVGNVLNKYYKENYSPNYSLPCHRVIRSNGKLGGYGGGEKRKKSILEKELLI